MKVLVSSSQCAWLKGLWLQAGEPGTGESFLWETRDWAWLRGCPGGAGQMEQATRQEVCPGWPGGFPVWLGHWSFWALGFSEEVIGRSEEGAGLPLGVSTQGEHLVSWILLFLCLHPP